ncbi:hypothetical protein [Rhodohalobacter sulfatireducens]|uniref:FecR protein domain-containing protein n=1 Tax=Rhodohalobacter sulfatireducens TaxID=2911366 RepID=A0ABS9KGY4_9BACT|nr:hypothetical protein [Rhodohalobacter sulfatireducens]MCG2590103.1 hypothetical protein [Rhodohalobacter sulfatireducens]
MSYRPTLLLICLFVFTSCSSNPGTNVYQGKKIEIDYRFAENIQDQSWVKVDTIEFRHERDRRVAENSEFILPTSEIVLDSLETGRTLRTRSSSNSIPMYLSRAFALINISSNDDAKNTVTYVVPDPSIASVTGKFVVQKSDSSLVRIEVPKGYPADVNVLID